MAAQWKLEEEQIGGWNLNRVFKEEEQRGGVRRAPDIASHAA